MDGAGYVYVQYAQTVAVLNSEGEYQYALQPVGSYIDSILKNESGNVFVASMADNEMHLQCYQAGVDTLLYEYVVDAGNAYYSGYDNYDVLCVTDDGIYGFSGDNSENILSYSESGISFVLLQGVLSVDENLLCVDNGGLYLLKLVPADEITPVTVVTLGVFSDYSNLDWVIQQFNASSETYYVQKIKYCADGSSYSEALQALNLDFLTGDAPDIILFSGMNYMQYSEKGFLLDILTLFEEDAQISVEDFFLTDTLQEDGHLYCFAPGFSVLTYYGSSSVFGQQTGWTYDDLCELLSAYGGFPDTITSVDFLTNALLYYLPDALDWATGICNFESEEFLQILSAAANIPDATQSTDNDGLGSSVPADYVYVPEEILVANGQQFFAFANLFSVSDIGELENDAGCSFTFIGWPTLNGDSGSSIYLSDTITVNAASDELDGVWSFLKYCINDDTIQSTSGWLPVKKSVLEAQVVTAQNAENSVTTDESVQKLYDLIVRTECVYQYDNVIQPIIVEEAAAYFAGEKSAEDTARIIQDRLSTYLAERR